MGANEEIDRLHTKLLQLRHDIIAVMATSTEVVA
jgi:hypothetical protein